jgi:hypothetical protein
MRLSTYVALPSRARNSLMSAGAVGRKPSVLCSVDLGSKGKGHSNMGPALEKKCGGSKPLFV